MLEFVSACVLLEVGLTQTSAIYETLSIVVHVGIHVIYFIHDISFGPLEQARHSYIMHIFALFFHPHTHPICKHEHASSLHLSLPCGCKSADANAKVG